MKLFLKILGVIGAIIALFIGGIFYMTSGLTATADDFFNAVKAGNHSDAFAFLSEDFQNNTSEEELIKFLTESSLANYKEASWSGRSVSDGRGSLSGSITTESDGVVPISLEFVKGSSGWKIYSIRKPDAGIQEERKTAEMPSDKRQMELVRESMHVFAVSVKDNDMTTMYEHISRIWQDQTNASQLDEVFASFYQYEDALMALDEFIPQFTEEAVLTDEGVLTISGLYPSENSPLYFTQKYIYEGLGWKLFGLSVNIE